MLPLALRRVFAFGVLLWLFDVFQSVQAIEIVAEPKIPAPVLANVNAHVSVFAIPENCEITNRYRSKIKQAVESAIRAKSYYQAQINELEPVSESECQRWKLAVNLGAPLTVRNVELQPFDDADVPKLFAQFKASFPFKSGEQFDHKLYEQWKSDVTSITLLQGYFDFKFVRHELLVLDNLTETDIALTLKIGARYKFGELINISEQQDKELITRLRPFQPGDNYDSSKLNEFTQHLKRSGYFSTVFVRPLVPQSQNNEVPLEVVYQFKPAHEFNVGGGVSSDTGPRARFGWRRSRLNSAGHSIESELFASFIEQSLALNYRIPLTDPARNFVSLQAGVKHTDDNDTQSDTLTLAVKRHWLEQESGWQRIAQLRYDQESFRQATAERETTTLLLPGVTFTRFRSEGNLDPYWGDKQTLSLEGASKAIVSDIDLARVLAQTRWLRTYDAHRVFLRAELGTLTSSNFAEVPSSLRFFAGGDQSVRGFGYETLAPRDEEGQLTGGKYLYTSSIEYTYDLYPEWRVALFADAGNAGMSLFDDIATGYGAGVHWVSPVGPLRVYLARGHSQQENTWRIHFSLGSPL